MHRKNTGQKYTKTLTMIISVVGFGRINFFYIFQTFHKEHIFIYYFHHGGGETSILVTRDPSYWEAVRPTWC